MSASWVVSPDKVQKAVRRIIETSNPRKIILFGSYIKGTMNQNSDLDVLVVARDNIESPRKESIKIRRALRGIGMAIVVVPESVLDKLCETPGLVYREAVRTGEVAYESEKYDHFKSYPSSRPR